MAVVRARPPPAVRTFALTDLGWALAVLPALMGRREAPGPARLGDG